MNLENDKRWATLRWRLADGRWAGVFVVFGDLASVDVFEVAVMQVAQWIRLDRAYKCRVDFRLTWVPAGSSLAGCERRMRAQETAMGVLIAVGGGRTFTVLTDEAGNFHPYTPNTTVDGRQVEAGNGAVRRLGAAYHRLADVLSGQ